MPTSVSNQCCSGVNIDKLTTDITKLTQEVSNLQMQLNQLKDKDSSIEARVHSAEQCCSDTKDRIDQQDSVIGEQADNITVLKDLHVTNKKAIEGLEKKVIVDDEYLNFQEWVENVYIPQCDHLVNKYSEGDVYINVNQDVAATNATYVNIKNKNSQTPCSANDWQEVYYSAPADVLTILGIDPIKVTHPYKHERVISVDPNRLADMISQLRSLDLTKVEITMDKVYFTPTFKEDVHFDEDITVEQKITTNEFHAEKGFIRELCVGEFTCDAKIPNIETNNITFKKGTGDQIITNQLTTKYFEGDNVVFKGPVTYISKKDGKPVCIDNVMDNTFRPSYGLFYLGGSCYTRPLRTGTGDDNLETTVVFGLGSDSIGAFNNSQANPVPLMSVSSGYNNTWITQDTENYTRNIYLDNGEIIIDGHGDDAGIYQITMQLAAEFSPAPDRQDASNRNEHGQRTGGDLGFNFTAHRAGIVIYSPDTPHGIIFDDKQHGALPNFYITIPEHHHNYREKNDGQGSSGPISSGWIETTPELYRHSAGRANLRADNSYRAGRGESRQDLAIYFDGQSMRTHELNERDHTDCGLLYIEPRSDKFATYTVTCAFPVNRILRVAPFFKPSSATNLFSVSGLMKITEGEWNTGTQSQIFIHKIANLGEPDEYHCQ